MRVRHNQITQSRFQININNKDNDDGKNAYKKYEVEATEKAQGD